MIRAPGAKWPGLLTEAHPAVRAYLERLEQRPALQKRRSFSRFVIHGNDSAAPALLRQELPRTGR